MSLIRLLSSSTWFHQEFYKKSGILYLNLLTEFCFLVPVAPDPGLGLVQHQGDALPPAPTLVLAHHQRTTRETGMFEPFMFSIDCRLYSASVY